MPSFCRRSGTLWAKKLALPLQSRRDGKLLIPDLYEWGLSGTAGSAERKTKLLCALGLPPRLSKKELVEALNRLYSYEQLDEMQSELLKT